MRNSTVTRVLLATALIAAPVYAHAQDNASVPATDLASNDLQASAAPLDANTTTAIDDTDRDGRHYDGDGDDDDGKWGWLGLLGLAGLLGLRRRDDHAHRDHNHDHREPKRDTTAGTTRGGGLDNDRTTKM